MTKVAKGHIYYTFFCNIYFVMSLKQCYVGNITCPFYLLHPYTPMLNKVRIQQRNTVQNLKANKGEMVLFLFCQWWMTKHVLCKHTLYNVLYPNVNGATKQTIEKYFVHHHERVVL